MLRVIVPLAALLVGAVAPGLRAPAAAHPACDPPDAAACADDALLRRAGVTSLDAPRAWRAIYGEVERCSGLRGDFDRIRWGEMPAPIDGARGTTHAFTAGDRIVLVRGDTTYLRHEMMHHILLVHRWRPPRLAPGARHTIADLHPMPLFGLCTGGR